MLCRIMSFILGTTLLTTSAPSAEQPGPFSNWALRGVEAAQSQGFDPGTGPIVTIKGPLSILVSDTQNRSDEMNNGFQLMLNGKTLDRPPLALPHDFENIAQVWPQAGPAEVLLISQESGGTACPGYYQIIDLRGETPFVSDSFSTCSLQIQTEGHGNWLAIKISIMNRKSQWAHYRYQDRKIEQLRHGKWQPLGDDF